MGKQVNYITLQKNAKLQITFQYRNQGTLHYITVQKPRYIKITVHYPSGWIRSAVFNSSVCLQGILSYLDVKVAVMYQAHLFRTQMGRTFKQLILLCCTVYYTTVLTVLYSTVLWSLYSAEIKIPVSVLCKQCRPIVQYYL